MSYREILAIIESNDKNELAKLRRTIEELPEYKKRLFKVYLVTGYNPYLSVGEIERLSLTSEDIDVLTGVQIAAMEKIANSLHEDKMEVQEFYDVLKESKEMRTLYNANKNLYEISKKRDIYFSATGFMSALSQILNMGDLSDYNKK